MKEAKIIKFTCSRFGFYFIENYKGQTPKFQKKN